MQRRGGVAEFDGRLRYTENCRLLAQAGAVKLWTRRVRTRFAARRHSATGEMHALPRAGEPESTQRGVVITGNELARATRMELESPPLIRRPNVRDGADVWRLARDSGSLDLNSPYCYLLWCTHHAATSRVARQDDRCVGFLVGYEPPTDPGCYFVWQIAVAADARGQGLARRMIDDVLDERPGRYTHLAASFTPDNEASQRLFRGLVRKRLTAAEESLQFAADAFPEPHEAEYLIRIGPFAAPAAPDATQGEPA